MAILGQIRSQSIILIIVIGLALFAFVISGVFDGKGYQAQQPVGIINGQDILIEDFRGQVDFLERNYNQKGMVAVNNVWNQRLRSEILNQQFEITGIQSGKDHLQNILKNNPTFNSDQQFLNEAGIFDIDKFKALIIELKTTNPEAYENWKNQEKIFESQSNEQIYFNLVRAGINYTQTDGKFEYNLQNDNVDIEYIQIPYSSVEDSLIPYTRTDLKKYIDNNKDEFKVDASRNIEYVIFEEKPSFDDENAIKNRLNSFLKETKVYNSVSRLEEVTPSLINAKNIKEFINEYSETSFDSIYLPKGSLPADHANLLFNLNNNQTYGPYLDGDYFKISRMLDKKIGGSVRSSHILLAYKGSQNANPNVTRSKKEAKKEANNILRKIRKSPETFTELAFEFSDGPSKSRGGDIGFVQDGNMVKPFNDFIFSKRVGSTGLVETDFGFHVIKIVAKDDLVLLASITEKNVPSDETSDKVFNSATKLEMNLSKEGNLNALADKDDYILKTVNGVQILDNDFPGLKDQRRIVQWLFSETTNISDYKKFDLPKGGYLIAQVTGMVDEGVSNVQDVSYKVLPMVLKSKKADFIISKNDNSLSIEKIAEMNGVDVRKALALNQKNATITESGLEPLVIGSSFGTSLNQTSDFIIGENGVYKLKVLNRKETGFKDDSIDANFVVSYKNQLLNSNRTSAFARVYESLKENTEVSDNRSIYY
ncbi:peptidylprolyl isomerase [Flavobacteriaceae bacterium]|nr:peptidylprolyl isomerase [Flavobacteriaceae bacterium]MDB9787634.1 peptidylprolyl isomerase [Flavobacteriaceae bacterium]MDB9901986.1 peptidylprolyl isomerase [Flavobacteriaceae bacterium]MDC0958170.1 peptidylprolyl isomerase [Flavobacteriaceae bacterium]